MHRHSVLLLLAGALLAGIGGTARADTLMTGVLSPDTAYLICKRADADFWNFGADGYGCKSSRLMIACQANLECVSKVRDLNSYLGNQLAAYLRRNGMRQVDTLSQPYPDE